MDPKFFLCVFVLENRIWMFRVTLPNRLVAPISGCWWNTSLGAKVLVDEILTAPVGHSERRTWRAHNYCACIRLSNLLIRISSAHTMLYDIFSGLGFHHFYLTIFVVVPPTIPYNFRIKWGQSLRVFSSWTPIFSFPPDCGRGQTEVEGDSVARRLCRELNLVWLNLADVQGGPKKNSYKWGEMGPL